jgi:hypothetical protein
MGEEMVAARRRKPELLAAAFALALFAIDFNGYSRGESLIQTHGPVVAVGVALIRFVIFWRAFAFFNVYERLYDRRAGSWTRDLVALLFAVLFPLACFLTPFLNRVWPAHH